MQRTLHHKQPHHTLLVVAIVGIFALMGCTFNTQIADDDMAYHLSQSTWLVDSVYAGMGAPIDSTRQLININLHNNTIQQWIVSPPTSRFPTPQQSTATYPARIEGKRLYWFRGADNIEPSTLLYDSIISVSPTTLITQLAVNHEEERRQKVVICIAYRKVVYKAMPLNYRLW